MSFFAACAEFPNDNADLHGGAVWVSFSPTARPRAVLRATAPRALPSPPAAASELERLPGLEAASVSSASNLDQILDAILLALATPEPEPELASEPSLGAQPEPELEPEPETETETSLDARPEPASEAGDSAGVDEDPDGFCELVAALSEVALASGATRAAAVIADLFEHNLLQEAALAREAVELLVSRGFAERRSGALAPSEAFVATVSAWRAVLRSEEADLSACGAATLDRWAAEVLAALSGTWDRVEDLRRELRRRGVAAFGIIAQAA